MSNSLNIAVGLTNSKMKSDTQNTYKYEFTFPFHLTHIIRKVKYLYP